MYINVITMSIKLYKHELYKHDSQAVHVTWMQCAWVWMKACKDKWACVWFSQCLCAGRSCRRCGPEEGNMLGKCPTCATDTRRCWRMRPSTSGAAGTTPRARATCCTPSTSVGVRQNEFIFTVLHGCVLETRGQPFKRACQSLIMLYYHQIFVFL